MTARPPRASTKGEAKRPKARGATGSEKAERADKRRAASVVQTDQYERILDDEVVEVTELPAVPRLRMLVLESAPHLASAQGAIVASGHVVVIGATGREGIDKLRFAVGDVDAMLVGMPGGEPLIDAALAYGPRRPLVIAAYTCGAVEAARRAAAAGADLATVRPHDVERVAPLLLAAGRLLEQRDQISAAAGVPSGLDELDELDERGGAAAGGLVAFDELEHAAVRELARAERYGYPLSVAMFSVDIPPPAPPPGLRGILRARAANALVHALRDIDFAAGLDQERFLVLMPHTDRAAGADVARRIISAVAAGDPVTAAGRTFPPKVIGAVVAARPGEPDELTRLVHEITQLLEQAQATGASLAVET